MNKKILIIIGLVLTPLIVIPLLAFFTDELYVKYWENKPTPAHISKPNSTQNSSPQNSKLSFTKASPDKLPLSIKGFDWSLSKNTKVSKNSGLIDEYDRGLDFAQSVFAIIRWDKANPQKGRYDFSRFENYLKEASPKGALVRLEVNSACEAPKWAQKTLRSSPDKSLIFWDQTYIDLLTPFINAFAKRYANDPRIIGVQLGIGDGEYDDSSCDFNKKDGWGEFWMSPKSIALAQDKYGFTADIFEKQTKTIIDVYLKAFGKNKGKLAFTNIGPSFSWSDIAIPYNQKLKKISQYVWQHGLGNRDGHVELWMRFIERNYGVQLKSFSDGTCFLSFDEDYANRIRGRYWGTENEFYGDKGYVISANGPYKNQAYRFMVSSLRALQMRRNYFSIAGGSMAKIKDPLYKTQDFLYYLTKVMGKQIENTPDVFILLGERYISKSHAKNYANESCVKQASNKVAVRSFGRWLSEKSISKPAVKISMPASENYWGQDFYMPQGVDYEYSARLGNKFEFDINDRVIKTHCKNQKPCKVEIKISYKDSEKTALNLNYVDSFGENKYQSFQSIGDNKIKTVSFTVNSRFQNKLMGSDFIITSKNPLPLIMIRVNFL